MNIFSLKEVKCRFNECSVLFLGGLLLSLISGCQSDSQIARKPAEVKTLNVSAGAAHVSPENLNLFLINEIPSPRQRIQLQTEVVLSLYASGQRERSRELLAKVWRDAAQLADSWQDGDSPEFDTILRAAFLTSNRSIIKKCAVALGENAANMMMDRFGENITAAMTFIQNGDIKSAQSALVDVSFRRDGVVTGSYDDLDYIIRSLNKHGRTGAAKSLLAPIYSHWFPPKEKSTETGNIDRGENGVVHVNYQEAAAGAAPDNFGPFVNPVDYCRFLETYILVHGQTKAKPLIEKLLGFAQSFQSASQLLQSEPVYMRQQRKAFGVDRTFNVLQEAAPAYRDGELNIEAEAVIRVALILAKTDHRKEAERLVGIISSAIGSDQGLESDTYQRQEVLMSCAQVHIELGNNSKAISAIEEATDLALYGEFDGIRTGHYSLSRLAVLYGKAGANQQARELFSRSLKTFYEIKQEASIAALMGYGLIHSGEFNRELEDLSPSQRVKISDKNKAAHQRVIFDLIGSDELDSGGITQLIDVNFYLMEMAGWLSYGNYNDDWEYRNGFSKTEQSMAQDLIRVVLGEAPEGIRMGSVSEVWNSGLKRKRLPSWLNSVHPDSAVLGTFDINRWLNMYNAIPDEVLQNAILSEVDVPEWSVPLIAGPLIKFTKGARFSKQSKPALSSGIEFVPDEYKVEYQLLVGLLSGDLGFPDDPSGFWFELLPPVQEEGKGQKQAQSSNDENEPELGDASEIKLDQDMLMVAAIPIRGGGKIATALKESKLLKKYGVNLSQWGKYTVSEPVKLGQFESFVGPLDSTSEDIPIMIGIKEDQIVIMGITQISMENGQVELGSDLTEADNKLKAHWWKKFSGPNAQQYDTSDRFKRVVSNPALFNIYFGFQEWFKNGFVALDEQTVNALNRDQIQILDMLMADSKEEDVGFGFSFDITLKGAFFEMTLYNDKWPEGRNPIQKELPRTLQKLLVDSASMVGAYSMNLGEVQKQSLKRVLNQQNLQLPEDQKLDEKALMDSLDEEFEDDNGFKLSTLLSHVPDSVVFVGPKTDQKLSELGGAIPDFLLGVKLKNAEVTISDVLGFVAKQTSDPFAETIGGTERMAIKDKLQNLGLHIIQKDGYIYLCSGSYKTAIEQGRAMNKTSRPDIIQSIENHGASFVIDGSLIRLAGNAASPEDQISASFIDKLFIGIREVENGDTTFGFGTSFKPGGLTDLFRTIPFASTRVQRHGRHSLAAENVSERPWNEPKGYQFFGGGSERAAVGGILGGVIGHQSGRSPKGAAVGAAAGGAVGAVAGAAKDKVEKANNSKFVALGTLGSQLVQCTALQETVLPDGRLQVRANILNRANKRLDLQVNCIFKDDQGFATGDETPFRTLVLDETAQETVLFTSIKPKAKNYTVRVRLAR